MKIDFGDRAAIVVEIGHLAGYTNGSNSFLLHLENIPEARVSRKTKW